MLHFTGEKRVSEVALQKSKVAKALFKWNGGLSEQAIGKTIIVSLPETESKKLESVIETIANKSADDISHFRPDV